MYVCTTSPRDVNDILTFENVEESVSELKNQLVKLGEEHMDNISKKGNTVKNYSDFYKHAVEMKQYDCSYYNYIDQNYHAINIITVLLKYAGSVQKVHFKFVLIFLNAHWLVFHLPIKI